MEFIKQNFINTTTQLSVNSNTATVSNIFNPDPYFQYYTDGLASDLTTSSMTIAFTETTLVSRIAIKDTNAKEFRLFYNGATANAFALSTTGSTISSSWTTNTESDLYLRSTPVYCTSLTLEITKTQTANQEKRVGFLAVSDLYYELTQIPNASGYDPRIIPKQIEHKLSDGGTRIHNIRKKWEVSIKLDYISASQRNSLKTIYDLRVPFIFCPFGTATSWDGMIFESVWPGNFDFYQFSDNASVSGFSGGIKLKETPT